MIIAISIYVLSIIFTLILLLLAIKIEEYEFKNLWNETIDTIFFVIGIFVFIFIPIFGCIIVSIFAYTTIKDYTLKEIYDKLKKE